LCRQEEVDIILALPVIGVQRTSMIAVRQDDNMASILLSYLRRRFDDREGPGLAFDADENDRLILEELGADEGEQVKVHIMTGLQHIVGILLEKGLRDGRRR
jgi:hypothetical protein